MARLRSCRPRRRLRPARAGGPVPRRPASTSRPRLELLEDRIQPGDTILGLGAVAVWGLASTSVNDHLAFERYANDRELLQDSPANFGVVDLLSTDLLPDDVPNDEGGRRPTRRPAIMDPSPEIVDRFADSVPPNDGGLASQLAVYRLGDSNLPESPALAADLGVSGGGAAPGIAFSAFAFAATDNTAGRSLPMFASEAASSSVGPVSLSFQASTGQLTIESQAGEHTIREAPDGFVDVTIDGQRHSSNPASSSFDRGLAGATGATVASIRSQAGGQDTLILGSQQHAGGFTVQAAGASVVTENALAAGPLTIQAPDITVNGALQGSAVNLTTAGWLTINAAGRVDAEQKASGGPIQIDAAIFVNSGQLHADGPTGGQINIAAGKILNAGPITADGTGRGGKVHIAFTDSYVATTAAVISASSADGPGGQLTVDGGATGHLFSSGRHVTTGSTAGSVDVFGWDIVLAGALIDASGQTAGGSVRIGDPISAGDDTDTVTVTSASTVRADALRTGAGGRVSVRANQNTAFNGTVSARGGPAGGAGGFIDVSGQGTLSYDGSADAGAKSGKSGTLLLDPKNITISDAPDGVFPRYALMDPHPTVGGSFGSTVLALNNGNVVVTNPDDDFGGMNAGAVYLFDGFSGALTSALVGSHSDDEVGSGNSTGFRFVNGAIPLTNDNYVAISPYWNGYRGAVTWGSAETGVSGTVSDANSLVGGNPGDRVGTGSTTNPITALSNGNYAVSTIYWNYQRGAATWGNGRTGTSGIVSDANSLVGSNPGDIVGSSIIALSNGNYVVDSPGWNGNRGAVTWGNARMGISGIVSGSNSLIGSNRGDDVGLGAFVSIIPLSNGNYVVDSELWKSSTGAVTWGDGNTGITGTISEANSLVGSNPGDYVGAHVTPLNNGNYVVGSYEWSVQRGAVTWGNGDTGISGTISGANSLVGSDSGDFVGFGVTPLSNGNYLAATIYWNGNRGGMAARGSPVRSPRPTAWSAATQVTTWDLGG